MKKVFTEEDIIRLYREGSNVVIAGKADIFTPSALDKIKEFNLTVKLLEKGKPEIASVGPGISKVVAIGGDHTGFKIKSIISKYLTNKSYNIKDVGTFSEQSCDYPDFAYEVAQKVVKKEVEFGIIIDATGIPSAITANKVPGIRAATCYNEFSAKSAREHNDANILVLGAKTLGEETIKSIIDKWIVTDFAGERHQRRLDKITAIERRMILNKSNG